jgi:hypothetical protein
MPDRPFFDNEAKAGLDRKGIGGTQQAGARCCSAQGQKPAA